MQPTVGRIVHYFDSAAAGARAALVCAVQDDGSLNLAVFDPKGNRFPRLGVAEGPLAGQHWTWPERVETSVEATVEVAVEPEPEQKPAPKRAEKED